MPHANRSQAGAKPARSFEVDDISFMRTPKRTHDFEHSGQKGVFPRYSLPRGRSPLAEIGLYDMLEAGRKGCHKGISMRNFVAAVALVTGMMSCCQPALALGPTNVLVLVNRKKPRKSVRRQPVSHRPKHTRVQFRLPRLLGRSETVSLVHLRNQDLPARARTYRKERPIKTDLRLAYDARVSLPGGKEQHFIGDLLRPPAPPGQ